eukprot:CAMPEP_0172922776 /NCGR_PEP_ID=MMETSP1075-20121228/208523_1 /TAXON_ID=2916 /ORGANISM="Ceratium fusus, Strain PA161109" /LENGTH=54 /DNA_ID=CAMNT_0013783141 /DNA_START=228 /DNA_END=392 /DNA_ORIENTATION=-
MVNALNDWSHAPAADAGNPVPPLDWRNHCRVAGGGHVCSKLLEVPCTSKEAWYD